MSHEVESMFSVREKPWHYELTKDVTKIIQEAPTSEEALEAAGLNWDVIPQPIFLENGIEIPNAKANVRSTDNSVLGIVTDRYSIVQNKDAFAFTDALIGGEVRYETAGSLFGGKKVWMLVKLEDNKILDDAFENYICFTNNHDGTGAVVACMTPTRVVCNNTLNLALNTAKRKWSTKHVGDVSQRVTEARETLGLADLYLTNLAKEAEVLATTKIDATMLEKILHACFPIGKDATKLQKETAEKQRNELYVCYMKPDLLNYRNTAWGLINAAADMADHSDPIRKTKNYDEKNWGKIILGHKLVDTVYDMVKV